MRRSPPLVNRSSSTSVLLTTTQLAVQTTSERKVDHVLKKRVHNESTEKNELEVTKENTRLGDQITSLKKQVNEKNLENERLTSDVEKLQQRLKASDDKTISESSDTYTSSTFLSKERELLENENRNMRTTLEEAEKRIKFLMAELTMDEQAKQEIESLLQKKDAEINEWKDYCKEHEKEISELHECNKVLNERLSLMESRKDIDAAHLPRENTTEYLDREFKFQCMQERIDEMNANIHVIEHEQTKQLNENRGLRQDNINLEAVVRKLTSDKIGLEKQTIELNEKLTILLKESLTLNEENRDLKLKTRELEKMNQDFCRKLDCNTDEYSNCRRALLVEKEELESTLLSLNQEFHSTNRLLEAAITKNDYYETTLQETKAALQSKITALLVMTAYSSEVEKARDNFKKRLQDMEDELKSVEAVKDELQRELLSCRSLIEQSVVNNEQNKTRSEHECSVVQSHYQKCLSVNNDLEAQIEELLEINDRQSRLLNESETRLSHFQHENHETETSLKCKISKLEDREKSICVSNQSTIEENQQLHEQVQEWIHKHEVEVEKKSQIENNLQKILCNNKELLIQIDDLSEKLEESRQISAKFEQNLRESEDKNKNMCKNMFKSMRKYNSQVDEKYRIEIAKNMEDDISDLLDYVLDELRSATTTVEDLRESKEIVERNLHMAEESSQYLFDEIKEMKGKFSKEVDEKSQIYEKMQEMSVKNKTLAIQIHNLSEQLEFEADKLKGAKEVKENLEKRVTEFTTSNELLHQQLQERIYKHDVQIKEQSLIHATVQNLISESEYLSAQIKSLLEKFKFVTIESRNFQAEKKNLEESLQTIKMNNVGLCKKVEEWRDKCIAGDKKKKQIFNQGQKLITESVQFLNQFEAFGMQHIEQNLLQINNEKFRALIHESIEKYRSDAEEKFKLREAMQKLSEENESLSTQIIDFLKKIDLRIEDVEDFKFLRENMKRNLEKTNATFWSSPQKNVDLTMLEIFMREHERLQEEKERLEDEIHKLLESNKEKFQFLQQVEERVHVVTNEMKQLKQVNEDLEAINSYLKMQVDNHFKSEHDLKNVNTKLGETINELKSRRGQLMRQLKKVSSENNLLSSRMGILKRELVELKEIDEEVQKQASPESDDTDNVSRNNETRLIREMEKLHDQNRYLRLEVDKLIAHVKLLINNKIESEFKNIQNTSKENLSDRYAYSGTDEDFRMNTHAISEANYTQEGNIGIGKILEELKKDNSIKVPIRVENSLEEIGMLHGMENMNHEAVQSQLQTISSKNAILFIENLQLRELFKSLQVDFNALKLKLQETEEKLQTSERVHAEEIQKLVIEMAEGRKREDMLLHQVETLNVKLVEEGEHVNILQRSHAAQLQKQYEYAKSLESKIWNCVNKGLDTIIEEKTMDMKTREDNMEIPKKEIKFAPTKTDNLRERDTTDPADDVHNWLHVNIYDLQEGQMVPNQEINDVNDILSSEEKDVDQLKSELHAFENDHQKLVQCRWDEGVLCGNTKLSDEKVLEKLTGEENISLEIKDSRMQIAAKRLKPSLSDSHSVISKLDNKMDTKFLKVSEVKYAEQCDLAVNSEEEKIDLRVGLAECGGESQLNGTECVEDQNYFTRWTTWWRRDE